MNTLFMNFNYLNINKFNNNWLQLNTSLNLQKIYSSKYQILIKVYWVKSVLHIDRLFTSDFLTLTFPLTFDVGQLDIHCTCMIFDIHVCLSNAHAHTNTHTIHIYVYTVMVLRLCISFTIRKYKYGLMKVEHGCQMINTASFPLSFLHNYSK